MAVAPARPKKGEDVLPWAQKAHDYMLQITPRSGATVKVKSGPGGTTFSKKSDYWGGGPYHFEVIADPDYEPSSTERQLAIRGGRFSRNAFGINEFQITAPGGPSPIFAAAGGAGLDDLALATSQIAHGETWVVYLGLWDDSAGVTDPTGVNPKALYATALVDDGRPVDPTPDDVRGWNRVLAVVTNTNGVLDFDQEWKGGNITDFNLQPDSYETGSPAQWIESLGYVENPAAPNERTIGLLQDRQVHEILIDTTDVVQYDNDFAAPYYDYATSGATQKKYARYDSHEADSWEPKRTKSLQIGTGPEGGTVVQWYGIEAMDDQTDHDKMIPYVEVDGDGNAEVIYDWPIQVDDGGGLRPRNDADGSAFAFDNMTRPDPGSALGSYSTFTFYERVFNTDQAKLEMGDESGAQEAFVPITQILSSDITWDERQHHDELDPTVGDDPYDPTSDWNDNPQHDGRYMYVYDDFNTDPGVGNNDANFRTSGDMYAGEFRVFDRTANIWNDNTFTVDIAGDTNDIELIPANTNSVSIQSTFEATLGNEATGAMIVDGGATVKKMLQINQGNSFQASFGDEANFRAGFLTNGVVDITFADPGFGVKVEDTDYTTWLNSGFGAGRFLSATEDIRLADDFYAADAQAGSINVADPFVYEHDGVPGKTLVDVSNLFAGGLFTNEAGWTVMQGNFKVAGYAAPQDVQIIGRIV